MSNGFLEKCAEQFAGTILESLRDCARAHFDPGHTANALPEMIDVFGDVAGAAGLSQITNRCHRGSNAQVEEESFTGVEREILPSNSLCSHRFQLFTNSLPFLVQIHIYLDVARIGRIITIYVVSATVLCEQCKTSRISVHLRVKLTDELIFAILFRETKRRIGNKLL
jgi:hypothetical protein